MSNYITNVSIKDFLVFKGEFNAEFCPGVNVLIGGNGTGKTTLMKVLYRMCRENDLKNHTGDYFFSHNNGRFEFDYEFEYLKMQAMSNEKLQKICVKSIRLNFRGESGDHDTVLQDRKWVAFDSLNYEDSFTDSKATIMGDLQTEIVFTSENYKPIPAIFAPVYDMLSHSQGLLPMLDSYVMDFDTTQIDVLRIAQRPITRELKPNCKNIIGKITNVIDGEVQFDGDRFFVIKKNGLKVEFALEASGLKRLGLLWKLLRNGLLESGTVLFWDEPEASINPENIPLLVDILLELQRGGVQIFVATHSYDIARWFELNKADENSLRYFNMRKDGAGIVADVADSYKSLPSSSIRDAGNSLLRRVSEVAAGKPRVNVS